MDNMYRNVIPFSQRKAPRGRYTLPILIAIVVVLFALYLYPSVRMIIHQENYKQFVSELTSATYRSSQKETLTAQVDGQTLSVGQDNAYGLCGIIVKRGPCYISNDQPQREPDVRLNYGVYGTMDLWDVPLEDDPNGFSSGVYIHFTSASHQGSNFSYLMVGSSMRDLVSRYLSPELNTPV